MNRSSRIYVAGGNTLLGVALRERLAAEGYRNLVGTPPDEPDLSLAGQVEDFFGQARPEYVFLSAGLSGGIRLNQERPADLMLHNLLVTAHVVDCSHRYGVSKLLYLASSCSYPREAPQPLVVASLMSAPLEPTNAAYATAKLACWQLCEAYRRQYGCCFVTAIPANAFGPHDDFGPESGHVIPGLMRRMHAAKLRDEPTLSVWGTGKPRREFIFVRDLADACLFVMRQYEGPEPINLGSGTELAIAEVARLLADVVGYHGRLRFDATAPDGVPLKMLDSGPLWGLGWRPAVDFITGLAETYYWFLHHVAVGQALPAAATTAAVGQALPAAATTAGRACPTTNTTEDTRDARATV